MQILLIYLLAVIERFVKCCDWIILTICYISFNKNWIVVILKIILSSSEVPYDTDTRPEVKAKNTEPFVDKVFGVWDQF